MTEEIKPQSNTESPSAPKQNAPQSSFGGKPRGRGGRQGGGRRATFDRPKPEFDQKMVSIRRVTRVVAGGRRMSFSVAIIIGDKKGSVGLGTGKGADTALAIAKALKQARKSMITVKTTKTMSIPYDISAKFCSSSVMFMPNHGRGVIAGSALRDIITIAGLKDITAKIHSGSKNKLNNARAAMKALSVISSRKVIHVVPVAVTMTDTASTK